MQTNNNESRFQVVSQENVKTGQTLELTNIASRLRKGEYQPPSEQAPHGELLCPDGEWRHIIGHNTRINNGVHLSYGLQQNIIIDIERDPVLQVCKKYTSATLDRLYRSDTSDEVGENLEALSMAVRRFLPYNADKVVSFVRQRNSEPNGDYQKLGDFVKMTTTDGRVEGAGICIHQALLAGTLLEQRIDQMDSEAHVGVFRNHDFDAAEAHAWLVYSHEQQGTWIIDPANQTVADIRDSSDLPWRYGIVESLH